MSGLISSNSGPVNEQVFYVSDKPVNEKILYTPDTGLIKSSSGVVSYNEVAAVDAVKEVRKENPVAREVYYVSAGPTSVAKVSSNETVAYSSNNNSIFMIIVFLVFVFMLSYISYLSGTRAESRYNQRI